MKTVVWNMERKRPATPTGGAAVQRIAAEAPELAVLTEARIGHLESLGGLELTAQPPVGKRFADDERKVLIWSARPWRDVDEVGDPAMPHGRFVGATTETSIGPVRVIGVCIPWHMYDVNSGFKDSHPWQQHLRWLELFGPLLEVRPALPMIVAGDFNQRIPRQKGGRRDAAEALTQPLSGFEIVTQDIPDGCARHGIDHIAIDPALAASRVGGWSNDDGGVRMSDHDAVFADLDLSS